MSLLLRDFLRLAGKSEARVIAVFAVSAATAERAVDHVRKGAPDVPVLLFSTDRETARLPERAVTLADPMALLIEAEKVLWPRWVALSVVTWTGGHGNWPLKVAPFLVPPFRVLILNEHGDFFAASPSAGLRHAARRLRDGLHSAWHRLLDLHRGLWLWLFAAIAQRFIFLSRAAFRRAHGRAGLEAGVPVSSGAGIQEIRHAQRCWRWPEVEQTVRTATARWLLFLEEPVGQASEAAERLAWQTAEGRRNRLPESFSSACSACQVDDLLPLFDDPRTFAVSRQVDYRDWKEGLFATAAFRPLQPGEASCTLAPVSPIVLVDRAKLAALGVPKTVVPGTAWLLLFWKAASAGWRSYSVGQPAPVELPEAPDWPYEEAEFVTRILSDPALRRLGTESADLSRGSIATTPVLKRAGRGLPRILIVSPYLPYPLSHGGAVRIFNLCRSLAGRADFILACFREQSDRTHYRRLHEVFREVYVLDRDEKTAPDRSLPRQVLEHTSRSLRALIRETSAGLLQIEYTHLAHFRDSAPDLPSILVEHDLTFTLYRQLAEQNPSRAAREEYKRWLAFERHALRNFNAVWTMSEADREKAVEEGSPDKATFIVANGVDLDRFQAMPPAASQEVFYVGSFRHLPNILGFEKLRREVMPRVWRRRPEATLRVVAGPEPERYWKELLREEYPRSFDPRIRVDAFVEDMRPLYAGAAVVAVPLAVSAGTNLKVMEAMACARAVVSTPAGCAGLGLEDDVDIVIRSDFDAFADAFCDLLADPVRRERIAAAARRTVKARFGWAAIAEEAWKSYQAVLG